MMSVSSTSSSLTMIFLVMSDRSHFDQRQAIRETWGSIDNDNRSNRNHVFFLVGGKPCYIPEHVRVSPYVCESRFHPSDHNNNNIRSVSSRFVGAPIRRVQFNDDNRLSSSNNNSTYHKEIRHEIERLDEEQRMYGDLIFINITESYSNLPVFSTSITRNYSS